MVTSLLALAHNKDSRGILINTVHQSGTLIALLEERIILQMEGERIDQRTFVVAVSRVDTHTCLLVHNNHIAILVYDINRYADCGNRRNIA